MLGRSTCHMSVTERPGVTLQWRPRHGHRALVTARWLCVSSLHTSLVGLGESNFLLLKYSLSRVWISSQTWSQGHNPQGQGQGQGQGLGLQGQSRTVSRPMSIWFAVQSKLQNTDVYCRAGIMTSFILIARFSKLVIKLTVSFSHKTPKYFRPSTCFPRPKTWPSRPRPKSKTWPVSASRSRPWPRGLHLCYQFSLSN